MTMVPSQSGKQNRITNYVIYGNTTSAMNQVEVEGYNCLGSEFVVRHMAEEEESSRANTSTTTNHNQPGSISKEEEEEERGNNNNNNNNNWLQLSIGFHQSQSAVTTTKHDRDHHRPVELELLPSGRHSNSRPNLDPPSIFPARVCQGGSTFGASLLFEQTTSSMSMSMPCGPSHQTREMMNWAFGPLLPHSMAFMPSSSFTPSSSSSSSSHSCSSLRPSLGSVPFNFPSGFDPFDAAGPSSDVTVRVVDPPPRPHSGIWFMLQASQNQAKEPFLPQIPKNYLRIKDGRMTVRLLLKYLVSKLKLESESEIEITCRGQQLLPFLTLQHVRDNIWTTRDTSTRALLSDSSTTDHVMVLHYGRSTA